MGGRDKTSVEDVLYGVILAMLLLAVILWGAMKLFHLERVFLTPCPVYTVTGWYCPGCGGTRALRALARGNLAESFFLHPIVPLGGLFLLVFLGSHTAKYLTHGRVRGLRFRSWYLIVFFAVLVLNWAIKNYLLLALGINLLTQE